VTFTSKTGVDRVTVRLRRQQQDEKHQRQARDHVLVKGIQRLVQQMAESHDGEDEAEAYKREARSEAEDHHRAGDQFHERNREADCP